jgi:hypothetical protein
MILICVVFTTTYIYLSPVSLSEPVQLFVCLLHVNLCSLYIVWWCHLLLMIPCEELSYLSVSQCAICPINCVFLVAEPSILW